MKESEVHVGMRVIYYPSYRGPGFLGTVAHEPWQLGHGSWVTKLVDMELGYAEYTGKRGDKSHTVFAASVLAMQPVQTEEHPCS